MANNIFSSGMAGVSNYLESNYGYASGTTPLRQSMIGSDDIQWFTMNEAKILADIEVFENMLADVDRTTQPMKVAFIKAKLSELQHSLAKVQAGIGSAGAMEALQADREHQAAAGGRTDADASPTNLGWSGEGFNYGEDKFVTPYGEVNISQFAPTYEGPGEYRPPSAYNAPSWMAPYMAQGGQVRPLGMQSQVGALQQAALWEQQTMKDVNSIEDYLSREPYIQTVGEEQRARSLALGPKAFQRQSQWEKALQR